MSQVQADTLELAEAFRAAMRGMANSVVMVTTWIDGQPWGLTVSACCSVSVSPPTLLISIGAHTVTAQAIRQSRRFGVNVLSDQQVELARFGAQPQAPKFCPQHCDHSGMSAERAPVIESSVAHFCCRAEQEIVASDHLIVIGTVESVTRGTCGSPLLHYERRFHKLGDEALYAP